LKPGLADPELELGRVEEKIEEEKIQCDPVDPLTSSFFLLKQHRFDFKKN
jgi:hypothetical protein